MISLFDKRKLKETIFGKNKMDKQIERDSDIEANITADIISIYGNAVICSAAAKTCYGLEPELYYDKCLKHVEKIMGYGHDSIAGHSNVVILFKISSSLNSAYVDLIKNLSGLKFFNISTFSLNMDEESQYTEVIDGEDKDDKPTKDTDFILLSGSVRAFRYYLYQMHINGHEEDNSLYPVIKNIIYSCIEKEFFSDFFKGKTDDLPELKPEEFKYHPIESVETVDGHILLDWWNPDKLVHTKNIAVLGCDLKENFYKIIENLTDNGYNFDKDGTIPKNIIEAIFGCSIMTLKLSKYSRAISQQINRHRSAISQESQRYVNYSEAQFIDPLLFNTMRYDVDKKYEVSISDHRISATSKELGQALIGIYHQLEEQGMINQDARSFLPMNVATKAVHTFTIPDLLHFIKLRTDQAAQPEVRKLAEQMKDLLVIQLEGLPEEVIELFNEKTDPKVKSFM